MTVSTKLEVRNILHCCQRTEAWPEVMYRKFCEVWMCVFWYIQADRHAHWILCTPARGRRVSLVVLWWIQHMLCISTFLLSG